MGSPYVKILKNTSLDGIIMYKLIFDRGHMWESFDREKSVYCIVILSST